MENVDRMIFDFLENDLQCSFFGDDAEHNNTRSLADLGADQVVEGIVRCLWKCSSNAKKSIASYKLPSNAVDRFRIASKISNEIKAIGVGEEQIVGYQALLYPNVFDSRRIFLALLEKLPKEVIKMDEKQFTPLEKLKGEVGEAVTRQMTEHWVPPFCRLHELQKRGRFWHPKDEEEEMGLTDGGRDIWAEIGRDGGGAEREEEKPLKAVSKPALPPKPKLLPPPAASSSSQQVGRAAILDEQRTSAEAEDNANTNIIEGKMEALAQLEMETAKTMEKLHKWKEAVEQNDERLLVILEEPERNLDKLKNFLAQANSRRTTLQEKFFAAKSERLEQLRQCGRGGTGGGGQPELVQLNRAIAALEPLLEEKRRVHAKLVKECRKMDSKEMEEGMDNRNKFVQRILEISAMVAKQNEEIRKSASSVQQVQREIDQLEGHLDRTFTAVNRWMVAGVGGREAEKVQRSLKVLVRTHEQCALVKEAIQAQGQLSRQLDELEDRLELETQKGIDGQMERLLDDLVLIRGENHKLEKRLNVEEEGAY